MVLVTLYEGILTAKLINNDAKDYQMLTSKSVKNYPWHMVIFTAK